jgi:hypothetical protein
VDFVSLSDADADADADITLAIARVIAQMPISEEFQPTSRGKSQGFLDG